MLCAVGDLVEDIVVHLSGPVRLGADTPSRVTRHRGGSAANTAAVAARLHGRARFVGQVGDDPVGDVLLRLLRQVGVEPAVHRGGRSGSVVVLVDDRAERTMLNDRAACTALADPDPAWLDGVTVLHVPGYSLVVEPLATSAKLLARWGRERGVAVSVDASSTTLLDPPEPFLGVLAEVRPDVLLANAQEAAALRLAAGALPAGVALAVVKDGPRPATVLGPGVEPERVPVPPVDGVVDTTGAGDAFAAGFLLAWVDGATPRDATAAGHAAAARVIRGAGGDAWDGPVDVDEEELL